MNHAMRAAAEEIKQFRRAPAWKVLPMLYCPPNTRSRCSGDPSQKAFRDVALIGSPTD